MYLKQHFVVMVVGPWRWRWRSAFFGIPSYRGRPHFVPKTSKAQKFLDQLVLEHINLPSGLTNIRATEIQDHGLWKRALTIDFLALTTMVTLLPKLNAFVQDNVG